ncbi:MAG: FAD binding domain-containing protein, partial [Rhizobiales bacterium]|nr:FAD binding domain-containing protein [Hyphomicrobiales bacterium]
GMTVGAGVTIAALARNTIVASRYRALAQAAGAIAAPGHRNLGTVGGNLCLDTRCLYYNQSEWWRHANKYCLKLGGEVCHVAPQGQHCHAAFSGDLAPALMALGAEAEIVGSDGRRRIPLADLYAEDGCAYLTLGRDELLVAVHLRPNPPASVYAKVRTRGAVDFPLAGVAVALTTANRKLTALRVALTGTNSRPFLLDGTGTFVGQAVDDDALERLDKLVQKQVQPMRTTTASAHYRRLAAAALARRLARELFVQSGGKS